MKKKYKFSLAIVSTIAALFIILVIYASFYYKAEEKAILVLENNNQIITKDNLTILSSDDPSNTALIFYPGAKVEAIAYLPILEQLQDNGITSILVKMPFNMAVFNPNAAKKVFKELPDIENWYIGGHSMGGAMASNYASKNEGQVNGLILLGAYVYGDFPPEDALTIYGTFNSNLEKNIDYTENIVIIEGGNHAQFGNYGPQKGDSTATITALQQQDIAVDAIVKFIKEKN